MKLVVEMVGFLLMVLDSEIISYLMDELIRKVKLLYNDGMIL